MALFRSIATVGSFTLLSRITGFIRDVLMTAIVGAGFVADCFVVAFKLPNLFRRLFAEGAFSAAFVPLFAEKLGEGGDVRREEARRFAEEALAVLLVVLLAFVALAQAFMPGVIYLIAYGFADEPAKFDLAVTLTRITFPYLLLISLVALLGGMLNALDRFAAMAAAPILLNLSLIASLLFLEPHMPTGGHALAIGVSGAGVLQFALLWIALRRAGLSLRLCRPRLTPGVKRLMILMAPIAVGAGAYQISLLTDVVIASFLPEGSLSFLFYADRLNQLPLGVVGIAVGTALLPLLSRQLSTGHDEEAMINMNRAIEIALFFALPAAVALMLVPEFLIGPLFERGAFTSADTMATAGALGAYAIGLPAYILVKVLSPAFFARQDTRTPIKASIVALVINLVLNLILMGPLLHIGLALATAVSAWVNVGILGTILLRREQLRMDARLKQRVPRALLASLVMGLAVYGLSQALQPWFAADETTRIFALLTLVGGGALAYGLAAHVFGALRAQELVPMIKGRSRAVAGEPGGSEN